MENTKPCLLFILILIIGLSLNGAHAQKQQKKLSSSEITKTRRELLLDVMSNNIGEVKNSYENIWASWENPRDYFSFKEHYTILFIVSEYDKILSWTSNCSVLELQEKGYYPDMFNRLNQNLYKLSPKIERELAEMYKGVDFEILSTLLEYLQSGYNNDEELIVQAEKFNKPPGYSKKENVNKKVKNKTPIKPVNFALGLGVNFGFYTGDISEYIYNYRNYLNLSCKVRIWRFYTSLSFDIAGKTSTINKINFYGDVLNGDFSGYNFRGIARVGYIAYSGKFLELVPNVGFYSTEHLIATKVYNKNKAIVSLYNEGLVTGLAVNIPILFTNLEPDYPWLILSTRYDLFLGFKDGIKRDKTEIQAFEDQAIKGIGHQFSLAIKFAL